MPDRPLPPRPLTLRHLTPTDAAGFIFLVADVAATAAGIWLASRPVPAVWLAGQMLLAAALVEWFVLLHECGHGTLFRTKSLHALVGHVAGFFALIPFHCWKWIHYRHHKWTGWQDVDPTTAALVPRPLGRLERVLVNVCWRYWIPLFSVLYRVNNFWNARRLLRLFRSRPRVRRRLLLNAAVLAATYAAVAITIGPITLVRLVGLALVLAFIVEDVLLLSQHTHVPMRLSRGRKVDPFGPIAQEPFTRSLRLPAWLSRTLLHFDAHELHHMYPFVPGYRLRQVPHSPGNEVSCWRWVPAARAVPGDVFLFQNRNESGFDV